MKQYKGLECPLDGFELVLFSLSGTVRGARLGRAPAQLAGLEGPSTAMKACSDSRQGQLSVVRCCRVEI